MTEPEKPKLPIWIWVVGGFLVVVVVVLAVWGVLGWMVIWETRKTIQKYEPTAEMTQQNIDRVNEEAEQWQKKSQQLREALPDLEDLKKLPRVQKLREMLPQRE